MPTSITTRQWYPKVYADEYTNTQLDIATDAIIPGQISTIAIDWMIQAEENGDFDIMLIQDFQETFAGWSLNHFNAMDMRVRTAVKNILRDRGVYIEKNSRNTIAQQLVNLLSLTRSPDWPIDELNVMRLNPDFKCRQIAEEAQHARTTQQSSNPPTQSASINYAPSPAQANVTALTNLAKVYSEEEKFSGDKYDVLDNKIVIFKDHCEKVGITTPAQYKLAVSTMLRGKASAYYYNYIAPLNLDYDSIIKKLGEYFHTSENYQMFLSEWRTIMLKDVIANNPDKTLTQCLDIVIDKLQLLHQAMTQQNGPSELALTSQLIAACQGVEACSAVLIRPASTFEAVASELRNAVGNWTRCHPRSQFNCEESDPSEDAFYTNRRYNRNDSGQRDKPRNYSAQGQGEGSRNYNRGGSRFQRSLPRSQYNDDTQRRNNRKCYVCSKPGCWSTRHSREERKEAQQRFRTYVQTRNVDIDYEAFLAQFEGIDLNDDDDNGGTDEELDAFFNNDQFDTKHQFLTATCGAVDGGTMVRNLNNAAALHAITKIDPYAGNDIAKEASHLFTLDHRYGREQFQGIMPDTGAAGVSTAGKQQVTALHRIQPLWIDKSTAGRHRIRFGDNPECVSIGDVNVQTPVGVIRFAVMPTNTPFLLCLDDMDRHGIYFNNVDNTLVHQSKEYPIVRKWGHPWLLLNKQETATHYLTEGELQQLHRRFGHPAAARLYKVLVKAGHDDIDKTLIDEINKFCHQCQITAKAPGRFRFTLRDDNLDFNSRVIVDIMYIDIHEVPVEAHHSIGKIERYHAAIRRAFEVISADIGASTTTKDDILQMAVKAVNDTAGPEGLVPTLLVFGTYPRLSKTSPPSPSITARATAIRKAMAEVRKIKAKRQVNEALGTRNGPNNIVTQVLELPLQSNVKVWREGLGWTGPHTLLALNDDQTAAIVDAHGKQASFRITSVQPYHQDDTTNLPRPDEEQHGDEEQHSEHQRDNDDFVPPEEPPQRRGRGRPKGSKNKPKTHAANLAQREKDDIVLARTLRTTGKITTPGEPFELSTKTEIDALITRGVFRFEPFNLAKHGGIRIFKSRIVNEVKGKTTDKPYEKSRLVVQGYADDGKKIVLTQSPTIQRASQRIIIALAPVLIQMGMKLWLRDITQAYTQSDDRLQRTIIADLPVQLRKVYPQGTIMVVVKPLYGIAEAGAYWWSTYFKHHTTTLNMETSTYDPCLLISKATDAGTTTGFGIVGMQTDDTLGLSDNAFADREDKELRFKAKDKKYLTDTDPIEFNGCMVHLGSGNVITLRQKKQGEKLENAVDAKSYIQQRARGAYIATICQPEASFDLAAAAQATEPTKEEISRLNKRINWQKKNVSRGLSYVPIEMKDLKLYTMVDASFANNKDMSSQMGYVIILGNETASSDGSFKIRGNIIHWSSTKCKRVTRSVLASEIYAMAHGVDIALAIGTTIDMIMDRLSFPKVSIVACTDSRSLYDCLVKLGTTKEKRLMIDIMALREAYERNDLMDIRWIDGRDNPADAMTKAASNSALEHLIDTNELELRVQGWVNRDTTGIEPTNKPGTKPTNKTGTEPTDKTGTEPTNKTGTEPTSDGTEPTIDCGEN
ncbi:hypothetical protein PtrM4_022400 [Pyrenophora tritici-repentis]|uniref:Polyprotein n=1 Tax=Pyrenophora tritici-repentis TaxID=45151 RepID=A0A834SAV4_9PLEO|nr:hypothetical protein PtrM4_022400 [Pyrenophora tritici-repentis]